MNEFLINSAEHGSFVCFAWAAGDRTQLSVVLSDRGLHAAANVFAQDCEDITTFLKALARDWKGWPGVRTCTGWDYDLRLEATNDGIGHIRLTVFLALGLHPASWQAQGVLELEAGQLDGLATEAARFFGPAVTAA